MTETLEIEQVPFAEPGAMLTPAEVAATLNISIATVWRRIKSGELRAVRLGSQAGSAVRVPAASVRAFARAYSLCRSREACR